MLGFSLTKVCVLGVTGALATNAIAQSMGTAGYGGAQNQHISFESPEAWALKYFASTSMLSGLQPPAPPEGRRFGSLTVGLELDWIPALSATQSRVGFGGTAPEDLNKVPILVRPVVRVGLPWKFSVVAAAPPPFHLFGVTAHLFEFGVERPIMEREHWTLGWRGYGQVGSVKGAFTCPRSVLGFEPGSPNNPEECIAESADSASLRYAGTELQFAYRIPSLPKWQPHVASGINYIDGVFHVNAPLEDARDRTRLWTHGKTFSETAGITYSLSKKAAITVDAFYAPLSVRRSVDAPRTNDGLFNVRALLSYNFR